MPYKILTVKWSFTSYCQNNKSKQNSCLSSQRHSAECQNWQRNLSLTGTFSKVNLVMFLLEPHGTCAIPGWLHTQRKVTALPALTHNGSYTFMLGSRNWLPRKHTTDITHPYGTNWRTYTNTTLLALALGTATLYQLADKTQLYYIITVKSDSNLLTNEHYNPRVDILKWGRVITSVRFFLLTSVLQVSCFFQFWWHNRKQGIKSKIGYTQIENSPVQQGLAEFWSVCSLPGSTEADYKISFCQMVQLENLHLISRYSLLLEYNNTAGGDACIHVLLERLPLTPVPVT